MKVFEDFENNFKANQSNQARVLALLFVDLWVEIVDVSSISACGWIANFSHPRWVGYDPRDVTSTLQKVFCKNNMLIKIERN